jgi:hypothetical protein
MTEKPFLNKFKEVIDKTDLSEQSKHTYKYRLERLTVLTKKDVDWILCNCGKTMQILESNKVREPQTLKGLINAVLTLYKHTKGLKEQKQKAYTCWVQQFKKVNEKAQEKYENIEASTRQIEAYVPWEDIIAARDKLDTKSQEYFILCLYTMLPPARADFNKVRIVRQDEITDEFVKEYPNYLVIMGHGMKLVYNEFKTKSKKLQRYEKVLPVELVKVIKDSLKKRPRDFLVISYKTGEPYHKPNSFTQHVKTMLFNVFKKSMSINTLRHSFVNSFDLNELTPMRKEEIARDMMHSPAMFDRYRLAIPAKDSDDGKAKICDVVCKDA